MKLTKAIARKVLETVDAGLCQGKGVPEPGKMCVEAAAMGLPHGDEPACVGRAVRDYKIALNDSAWSSNEARAAGMRQLAIAQLGSDTIDQSAFTELVCFKGITRILPVIFQALAKHPECNNKENMLAAVEGCALAKTLTEAKQAAKTAYASGSASGSAYAYAYASGSGSAYAYAYASGSAYASASAREFFTKQLGRDALLKLSAQVALEALIELKSPGCQWLDLCEEKLAA